MATLGDVFNHGTVVSRPGAGVKGRYWLDSTTSPMVLYYDDGADWLEVEIQAGQALSSITIREVDGSPTTSGYILEFDNGTVTVISGGARIKNTLTVQELDGSPDVSGVTTLRVSGGTITDNGSGIVTLNIPSGGSGGISGIGVKESDGTPNLSGITVLNFSGATVQDSGGGVATITISGGTTTTSGNGIAIGCKLAKTSGDVDYNTTGAAIEFDLEVDDTNGFHSTTVNPSRMTVPSGMGGVYIIGGMFYSAQNCDIRFRLNGSDIIGFARHAGVTITSYTASIIHRLSEGDYIEVLARGVGGTATISYESGISPLAWMYRIGDGGEPTGGGGGAPTDARYIVTSGNSSLSNEIIIPGLAASADRAGLAGAGFSYEFDTTSGIFSWNSAPTHDYNTTIPSHMYLVVSGSAEKIGTVAWAPAGDFDIRWKFSLGNLKQDYIPVMRLWVQNSDGTVAIGHLIYSAGTYWYISGFTYTGGGGYANANNTAQRIVPGNSMYARLVRTGGDISWFVSSDGLLWTQNGFGNFGITVARAGINVRTTDTNGQAEFALDWMRANV